MATTINTGVLQWAINYTVTLTLQIISNMGNKYASRLWIELLLLPEINWVQWKTYVGWFPVRNIDENFVWELSMYSVL